MKSFCTYPNHCRIAGEDCELESKFTCCYSSVDNASAYDGSCPPTVSNHHFSDECRKR